MKTKYWIVIAVIALLLINVVWFSFFGGKEEREKQKILDELGIENNDEKNNPAAEQTNQEIFKSPNSKEDSLNSNGGGGSSGSDSSTTSSSTSGGLQESCTTIIKKMSYSMKNFKKSSSCDEFNGEICTKLKVDCSVEVYNLENYAEAGGDFGINYQIINNENKEILASETLARFIRPEESELFSVNFLIDKPEGITEDISCSPEVILVPEVTVCE